MVRQKTKLDKYPPRIESEGGSELRKTVKYLLERDLKEIKNKTVLEIGCGDWDYAKKFLEMNGCRWYAFEPVNLGDKNLTLVKGSVENIPYHDGSFDLVLCNQTMEHWFEYGVTLKQALKEIHRVLKDGGVAMFNAPIHYHGDPCFVEGNLSRIQKKIDNKFWKIELFESIFPVNKVKGWKKIASKGFFSNYGYPNWLIPDAKNATSYILNIHLVKKPFMKKTKKKEGSLRWVVVVTRFVLKYFKSRLF